MGAVARWRLGSAAGLALLLVNVVVVVAQAPQAESLQAAAEVPPPQSERPALLALRRSITNWDQFAAANNVTGWSDSPTGTLTCLWTFVTCGQDARITQLTMACTGCAVKAVGTLPPELASLKAIITLNLQQNAFYGTLPSEWAAEGAFRSLVNLVLEQNQLTGTLPPEWASATAFRNISGMNLARNLLEGPLPSGWHMQAMLILRLHQNNFTGPLPVGWGTTQTLPMLRVVSLQDNQLSGVLPVEWAQPASMAALQELYLQDNGLTGGLPPSWARGGYDATNGSDGGAAASQLPAGFPSLDVLDVSGNPLGGTLLPEWSTPGSLPRLVTIKLSGVGLEGSLPPEWGQDGHGLAQMQLLWLDSNDLSGGIPPSWANLASLIKLYIQPGNEQLCGPLPAGLPFGMCGTPPDGTELSDGNCIVPAQLAVGGPHCPAPPPGTEAADPAAVPTSAAKGSSRPNIVAIVVPAVVGGLALATALLLVALGAKRRRRRMEQQKQLPFVPLEQMRDGSLHPLQGFCSDLDGSLGMGMRPSGGSHASGLQYLDHHAVAMAALGLEEPSRGPGAGGWLSRKLTRLKQGSGRTSSYGGGGGGGSSKPTGTPASTPPAVGGRGAGQEQDVEMQPQRAERPSEESMLSTGASSQVAPSPATISGGAAASTLGGNSGAASTVGGNKPAFTLVGGGHLQFGVDLPSDWEIAPDEIEICKRPDGTDWELGVGGFGRVYKALRNGAQPVAVKVLTGGSGPNAEGLDVFRREIGLLRTCRDPNIVAFLGASLLPNQTMLVLEHCDGGNLMRNLQAGKVTWYLRGRKILLDVVRGLVFLHSRRIVHFDLKSPNILLSRDGTAKIADVGMAKIIGRGFSAVSGNLGTLAWAAPELLLGARCTEKADIYSMGVVLWEVCTGTTPIRGQLRDVRVPEECPTEMRDLILDCLATHPSKRPSAAQLLERLRAVPAAPPRRIQSGPAALHPTELSEAVAAAEAAAVASVPAAALGARTAAAEGWEGAAAVRSPRTSAPAELRGASPPLGRPDDGSSSPPPGAPADQQQQQGQGQGQGQQVPSPYTSAGAFSPFGAAHEQGGEGLPRRSHSIGLGHAARHQSLDDPNRQMAELAEAAMRLQGPPAAVPRIEEEGGPSNTPQHAQHADQPPLSSQGLGRPPLAPSPQR